MKVKFRANLQPKRTKWTRAEIMTLLKYYPLYKAGNPRYNTGVIRGNLQNRTMNAISKKYWEIMGSEHKPKVDINQLKFDFLQLKLE